MHLDLQLARLQVDQGRNGVQQGLRAHGFSGLVAASHKIVHAVDDAACPLGLLGNPAQCHVHIVQGLWLGAGVFQQIQRAVGVAGNRGQWLVQLVAEQGGHFAHCGQSGGGLQTFLTGARELFDLALFADVDHRAHPAGLLTLHADQRRFDDQHRKARAVLAHEHRFETFTRRYVACQPDGLPLFVLVHHFGWPIGHGGVASGQHLGFQPHHLAKGRVHVSDATLQIARAQACDQRVFHRFAKGQRLSQIVFGFQASP